MISIPFHLAAAPFPTPSLFILLFAIFLPHLLHTNFAGASTTPCTTCAGSPGNQG